MSTLPIPGGREGLDPPGRNATWPHSRRGGCASSQRLPFQDFEFSSGVSWERRSVCRRSIGSIGQHPVANKGQPEASSNYLDYIRRTDRDLMVHGLVDAGVPGVMGSSELSPKWSLGQDLTSFPLQAFVIHNVGESSAQSAPSQGPASHLTETYTL